MASTEVENNNAQNSLTELFTTVGTQQTIICGELIQNLFFSSKERNLLKRASVIARYNLEHPTRAFAPN